MSALVHIHGVQFEYGRQPVLSGIDLHVETGTTLGLIGPNGGGKTTLIRLLLGVIEPTAGSIRIAELAPRKAVARGDVIGYLPQHPPMSNRLPLSIRQVVRLGLAGKTGLFKPYAREDLDFADSLLERVGVADMADRPVAALSGGELQRVFIARALAPRPKLLLLDEPTTGIDRGGQHQFIDFIQELKAALGLTIVFVSHDLRAVSSMSDRIACLNRTLHYHDVPDHLPADLVYDMFKCDLEAMGIKGGRVCTGCPDGHAHDHAPVSIEPAKPPAAAGV